MLLPKDIRDDFEVKEDGRVVCKSWRALARACDVPVSLFIDDREGRLRHYLKSNVYPELLPPSLKPLSGVDLGAIEEISEVVVFCLTKYVAWEAREPSEKAQALDMALTTIGLRAFFQDAPSL